MCYLYSWLIFGVEVNFWIILYCEEQWQVECYCENLIVCYDIFNFFYCQFVFVIVWVDDSEVMFDRDGYQGIYRC